MRHAACAGKGSNGRELEGRCTEGRRVDADSRRSGGSVKEAVFSGLNVVFLGLHGGERILHSVCSSKEKLSEGPGGRYI